jgi:transmembrane 9 superfamily protein 2/4
MFPFILAHIAFAMIPGTRLKEYKNKAEIVLFLNKLDSSKTLIPYKYNYLKYCDPKEGEEEESENIGQELSGDYLKESKYEIKMNVSISCKLLCVKELKDSHKERFRWMIENQYQASWVLDSLPAAEIRVSESRSKMKKFYKDGFPIGIQNGHEFYVFNHHNIELEYHQSEDQLTVVGFSVEPLNVKSGWMKNKRCDKNLNYFSKLPNENKDSSDGYKKELLEELSNVTNISYSYSVTFRKVATKWANRWGNYITPSESESTHYYNLVNSTLMVFLLTGMVATILRRSVLRDVSVYNESDELEIETGWKQVRSDAFRPPMFFGLFSILIGTGTQMILSCWITLIFAVFNLLSAKFQGALLSAGIFIYALMGIFAGYVSSRLYKMFGGISWQKNAIGTAILMPGVCMSTFLIINFFLTLEESSGAVSFESLLYLLGVWLVVSLGLVYMGAFVGTSKNPLQNSSKVSRIPKPVENVPGSNRVRLIGLLAGVLPFGSTLIEMNFIMSSLWHPDKFYHFFGFMFICSIILIITSAEAAILVVYLLLCREDYRWWWLSVFVPGSSGIYLFLFSVYYCFNVLELSFFTSFVMYFGYMFLICLGFMIVTGTIGFYGSYIFVNVIYSMIKQD